MDIAWTLTELDKAVRTYTDLRAQLNDLPARSEAYRAAEAELQLQIVRLKLAAREALELLDEAADGEL